MAYLHGRHDIFRLFVVEFEDTIQDAKLVVPKGLFALSVEGEE